MEGVLKGLVIFNATVISRSGLNDVGSGRDETEGVGVRHACPRDRQEYRCWWMDRWIKEGAVPDRRKNLLIESENTFKRRCPVQKRDTP